jgi:hypothetical protein
LLSELTCFISGTGIELPGPDVKKESMKTIRHAPKAGQEGIIFIPDISGFSKFVHDTDIKIGKEITTELLRVILQTNILGLKVSEIEGDAILFYKYGPAPTLRDLMNQYEFMLIAFKRKLLQLNAQRQLPQLDLSLKLIVHFGPIAEYKLYGFKKLHGEAIVEAHQLLKNDIASHNYILITKDFFEQAGSEADEIVFREWVKKERHGDLSLTHFLYDTEILKENVLQEWGEEFLFI